MAIGCLFASGLASTAHCLFYGWAREPWSYALGVAGADWLWLLTAAGAGAGISGLWLGARSMGWRGELLPWPAALALCAFALGVAVAVGTLGLRSVVDPLGGGALPEATWRGAALLAGVAGAGLVWCWTRVMRSPERVSAEGADAGRAGRRLEHLEGVSAAAEGRWRGG